MNLYSVDIRLCATAYIKAETEAEAMKIAKSLNGLSPTILDHDADVPVTGDSFDSADLPDVSLSPAMTIYEPEGKSMELQAENIPVPRIRETFTTPFEQHKDRIGQPFKVLRRITPWNRTEADRKEYDVECLPMYEIEFADGFRTSAFPDEVEELD